MNASTVGFNCSWFPMIIRIFLIYFSETTVCDNISFNVIGLHVRLIAAMITATAIASYFFDFSYSSKSGFRNRSAYFKTSSSMPSSVYYFSTSSVIARSLLRAKKESWFSSEEVSDVLSYDNAIREDSDFGGGRKSGVSVPAPIRRNLGTGGRGGLLSVLFGISMIIFKWR